jgi:hypothetical protein
MRSEYKITSSLVEWAVETRNVVIGRVSSGGARASLAMTWIIEGDHELFLMSSQTHDHHDAVVYFTSCLLVGIAYDPLYPPWQIELKRSQLKKQSESRL